MSAQIDLPALEFSHGCISPLWSRDSLVVCASRVLRRGYFNDYYLVDSKLKLFRALAVRKVRYRPPFWGWRLMHSRQVEVAVSFEEPIQLSLPDVISRVLSALQQEPDRWSAGWDLDELRREVRAVHSVGDVAALLNAPIGDPAEHAAPVEES